MVDGQGDLVITADDSCPLELKAEVADSADAVVVTLTGEPVNGRPCVQQEVAVESTVTVPLQEPLGGRSMVDGSCPDDDELWNCMWVQHPDSAGRPHILVNLPPSGDLTDITSGS